MDTIQSRRAQHRAAIRNAVITAAHDMNDMRWEPQDDALLDVIDDWLGKLEYQFSSLENFKQVLKEESETDVYGAGDEPGHSVSNGLPKAATLDDGAPLPGFLLRNRTANPGGENISTS